LPDFKSLGWRFRKQSCGQLNVCLQSDSRLSSHSFGIPEIRKEFRIFRIKFAQIPIKMFSTYKQALLRKYLQHKSAGTLPLMLQSLTPASVKDYLIQYLESKYEPRKDEKTLEAFFGLKENVAAYAASVGKTDIDKFRPVINFLNGKTPNPDDKQIHLAALLIGFERPYQFGKDYSLDSNSESVNVENGFIQQDLDNQQKEMEAGKGCNVSLDDGQNTKDKIVKERFDLGEIEDDREGILQSSSQPLGLFNSSNSGDSVSKKKSNNSKKNGWDIWRDGNSIIKAILFSMVIIAIFLGLIFSGLITEDLSGKQCMRWKEDRYVAVMCDASLEEGIEKVAIDTFLLNHFRMITQTDTITRRSIGKLWYLKHQKHFDYFTISGKHPIYRRKLSKLSEVIYRNEIESKRLERSRQY
jgi:hypothetical protein